MGRVALVTTVPRASPSSPGPWIGLDELWPSDREGQPALASVGGQAGSVARVGARARDRARAGVVPIRCLF